MNSARNLLTVEQATPLLDRIDRGRAIGVARTARKAWTCTCADRLHGFTITTRHENAAGETIGTGSRSTRATDLDEATIAAAALVGTVSNYDGTVSPAVPSGWVAEVTVEERPNPNYREGCAGAIEPGARHWEYLGDAEPYASGSRYCAPCAVGTWAPEVEREAFDALPVADLTPEQYARFLAEEVEPDA